MVHSQHFLITTPLTDMLKWQHFFISLIQSIWASDKQLEMVSLKNSFSQRYSNFQFENFDSAQCKPARSRNIFTSLPIKKLTIMLGYVQINNLDFFYLIFSIKARRGLQRKNWCRQNSAQCQPARSLTPSSLACTESDSTQCQPAQSRICAVLANFGFLQIFLQINIWGSV